MAIEKLGNKWLEIDLSQFQKNLELISSHAAPAKVLPVVKANAYGHGLTEMTQSITESSVTSVAVATIDEAIALRRHFIKCDILVLGAIPQGQIPDVINYQLLPTICDAEFAAALSAQATQAGLRIRCHFYIDTGMGRMGQGTRSAVNELTNALTFPGIVVEALYSHFSVADEVDQNSLEYTNQQRENFIKFAENPAFAKLNRHMANSAGVLQKIALEDHYVRPGILCYGITPNPALPTVKGLEPILQIKCKPLYIKKMSPGESVGYGRVYILKDHGNIMTLPVGYADGIPRRIASQLRVAVNGKRYPVVGRICMDMMMVDIGDDQIDMNDEVTLLGKGALSIEEWAQASDSIPYELFTQLGSRWSRVYFRDGVVSSITRPV